MNDDLENQRYDEGMSVPIKPARNPRWELDDDPIVLDEPVSSIDEDVIEILDELKAVSAVAQLESRVDALEHDIARIGGDQPATESADLTGELSIMKARVEDALAAISATVEEMRSTPPGGAGPGQIDEMKAEIRRGLDDAVDVARAEAASRLKQIRADVEATVSTARAEFQSSFTGLLQGLESGLQDAREKSQRDIERLRERIEPEIKAIRELVGADAASLRRDLVSTEETFSGALRAFAGRLESLQSQLSEITGRHAAERASTSASMQGLAQRIDGLEERMTEGLARLSEGILRVAESIGSAATLQRRIAALEAQIPKPKK